MSLGKLPDYVCKTDIIGSNPRDFEGGILNAIYNNPTPEFISIAPSGDQFVFSNIKDSTSIKCNDNGNAYIYKLPTRNNIGTDVVKSLQNTTLQYMKNKYSLEKLKASKNLDNIRATQKRIENTELSRDQAIMQVWHENEIADKKICTATQNALAKTTQERDKCFNDYDNLSKTHYTHLGTFKNNQQQIDIATQTQIANTTGRLNELNEKIDYNNSLFSKRQKTITTLTYTGVGLFIFMLFMLSVGLIYRRQ